MTSQLQLLDCRMILRRLQPAACIRSPAHHDYFFHGERELDLDRLRQAGVTLASEIVAVPTR